MTIMNASHEYEAARETFKAGDQRTLSSKIFKLHDFLMMHSFSFRHCDEENEVNVHRVHEATLFMATIISNQADRAIEEQTHLIEAETASASYRPSTSRSAKTPAVLRDLVYGQKLLNRRFALGQSSFVFCHFGDLIDFTSSQIYLSRTDFFVILIAEVDRGRVS